MVWLLERTIKKMIYKLTQRNKRSSLTSELMHMIKKSFLSHLKSCQFRRLFAIFEMMSFWRSLLRKFVSVSENLTKTEDKEFVERKRMS